MKNLFLIAGSIFGSYSLAFAQGYGGWGMGPGMMGWGMGYGMGWFDTVRAYQ